MSQPSRAALAAAEAAYGPQLRALDVCYHALVGIEEKLTVSTLATLDDVHAEILHLCPDPDLYAALTSRNPPVNDAIEQYRDASVTGAIP